MQTGGVDSKFHTEKKKNPSVQVPIYSQRNNIIGHLLCVRHRARHWARGGEGGRDLCGGAGSQPPGTRTAERQAGVGRARREKAGPRSLSGVQAGVARPRPRDADPRGWTSAAGRPGPPSTFAANPGPHLLGASRTLSVVSSRNASRHGHVSPEGGVPRCEPWGGARDPWQR